MLHALQLRLATKKLYSWHRSRFWWSADVETSWTPFSRCGYPQRLKPWLLSLGSQDLWYGKQDSPDLQTSRPQMAGEC